MYFKYYRDEMWSLEAPKDGDESILLRGLHCDPDAETLEHVLSEPTMFTVSAGTGELKSPEQLVGMVSCFFGNTNERLILQLFMYAAKY